MKCICGEDTVNTVEDNKKNLEYYINLVYKATAKVLWVKCYQRALHATETSFGKGRVNL